VSREASPWLLCAWLLWRGLAMAPGRPSDGSEMIVNSYDAKDECLKAAITKRNIRNLIIRQRNVEEPHTVMEVFTCPPVGAPPERANFE
jgi:hypothetical protein